MPWSRYTHSLFESQRNPKKNRALRFFNKVKSWKYFLRNSFPLFGAYTSGLAQFQDTVPELNTRDFVTWGGEQSTDMGQELGRKGGPSSVGTAAGYSRASGPPSDRQYAAVVRSSRSRFGRKKRTTVKSLVHETRLRDFSLISRFHSFQNGGFEAGLGGIPCEYRFPVREPPYESATSVTFPFHLFDVSSLPTGVQTSDNGKSLFSGFPLRHHQLMARNFQNQKEVLKFGWVSRRYMQESPSGMLSNNASTDELAIAVPVERTGEIANFQTGLFGTQQYTAPWCNGFSHDWSDIQMIMYPQTSLPCTWHVALVSFPDSLLSGADGEYATNSAGPPQEIVRGAGGALEFDTVSMGYNGLRPDVAVNNTTLDNLDMRWQKFWSGKLHNPINRDISGPGRFNASDAGLPFKIIKHESFYQPARDNVAFGGTAQRLIKKLFYRRDWTFSPSENLQAAPQSDAIQDYQTVQVHKAPDGATGTYFPSSPFPKPTEIVYLAVWCEGFKQRASETFWDITDDWVDVPSVPEYPSFDICVRMKHRISLNQNTTPNKVIPPPNDPAATMANDDPETLVTDAPVKKKRVKKNGILDAPPITDSEHPVTTGLA